MSITLHAVLLFAMFYFLSSRSGMRRCLPVLGVLDGLTSLAFEKVKRPELQPQRTMDRRRPAVMVEEHPSTATTSHPPAVVDDADAYMMPAQSVTSSHVAKAQSHFGTFPQQSSATQHAPSSSVAQEELAAKQTAIREAFNRRPFVVISGKRGNKYEIPLLPSQYMRLQGAERRGKTKMHDTPERLHHITQLNKLAAITDVKLPFRCLSCFHVFEAIPSTILKPQVGDLSSTGALSDAKAAQRTPFKSAKESAIWRSRHTVGARQREPIKACPNCTSAKVQWLCEYAHRSLHTPTK